MHLLGSILCWWSCIVFVGYTYENGFLTDFQNRNFQFCRSFIGIRQWFRFLLKLIVKVCKSLDVPNKRLPLSFQNQLKYVGRFIKFYLIILSYTYLESTTNYDSISPEDLPVSEWNVQWRSFEYLMGSGA